MAEPFEIRDDFDENDSIETTTWLRADELVGAFPKSLTASTGSLTRQYRTAELSAFQNGINGGG